MFNQTSDLEMSKNLDRPGAGIPWMNRMFLRLFLKPFVASRTPWEVSQERFVRVNKKIEKEIAGLSVADLNKRILVPPLQGIEDSSRYWSIAMTLEHLTIVGTKMVMVIRSLDQGVVPQEVADTAKVKPTGQLETEKVLQDFRRFVEETHPALLPSLRLNSNHMKYTHPWFGKMNAQSWYWLIPVHHGIHLRQILAIKKSLHFNSSEGPAD